MAQLDPLLLLTAIKAFTAYSLVTGVDITSKQHKNNYF